MKIPVIEICRAILWVLDTKKKNGDDEKIPPYEIQKKTGVSHNTIKTFVKRHEGNGIKINWSISNKKKIIDFKISEGFEEYLRKTVVPY